MNHELKINIGCGPTGQLEGFTNIDNSKAILLDRLPLIKKILYKTNIISEEKYNMSWKNAVYMDASRKLNFQNNSVDKIYSSHFLEHIPENKGVKVLRECYRVLKAGGVFRLVIPDLLWHSKNYAEKTEQIIANLKKQDYTRTHHDEFLDSVYGAYLEKKRYGLLHCYMYDFPTIYIILNEIGFQEINLYLYQKGKDNELCKYDTRPLDSIHIECKK